MHLTQNRDLLSLNDELKIVILKILVIKTFMALLFFYSFSDDRDLKLVECPKNIEFDEELIVFF